jgi:spore germination protein YaaH
MTLLFRIGAGRCNMKLTIQVITLILLLRFMAYADDTKPGRWGYLVQNPALTDNYLEPVMRSYTVLCMTGFKIGKTGDIIVESAAVTDKISSLARKHHVTLYPLVSFTSAALGHRILSSRIMREKTAVKLSNFIRSKGFAGVHLDFEYLPPEDAARLGDFLDYLRREYSGKITMAVFPTVGFPEKWNRFHDLSIIAPRVDEIVLMCYDYHGTHTGPGPVTDIRWAEQNIKRALERMRPSRIWLGIPAYGYRWCGGKAVALSAREGARLTEKCFPARDTSGTLRFFYSDTGRTCTVYISDKQTRSLLEKLASDYGLAGTALWRIGFDD